MPAVIAATFGPVRPVGWFGLLSVIVACAVTGCADRRAGAVEEVALSFSADVAAGDAGAACLLLAPATRERVERAGSCPTALAASRSVGGARVLSSQVWGNEALARMAGDTLFLIETGQGWRVAAAGCQARGEAPYDCELEGP